jgi:hypothetical protein
MLALFNNKYIQILVAALAALVFGFASGYSYKADKVELERLQQFEKITQKLDLVYKFSQKEASQAKETDILLEKTLNSILAKVKQKKLSSVPCTPSEDFNLAWRAIDNASKTTDSK